MSPEAAQKFLDECPAFKSANKGKFNRCELFTTYRYHNIFLKVQNDGVDLDEAGYILHVPELLIEINQEDVWRVSTEEYIRVEKATNPEFVIENGILPLNFSDMTKNGKLQQDITAIGTVKVKDFVLSVKLSNEVTLVNPSIEAHAVVDYVQEEPGMVRTLRSTRWDITETGQFKRMIEGREGLIKNHHLMLTAVDDVSNVRLKVEKDYKLDHAPIYIDALNKELEFTPDTKQIVIAYDRNVFAAAQPYEKQLTGGNLSDVEIEYELLMAAANSIQFVEDGYKAISV